MKCESREEATGRPCPAAAIWIIRLGSQKSDQQAVCGNRLNRAAQAFLGAEGRTGTELVLVAAR